MQYRQEEQDGHDGGYHSNLPNLTNPTIPALAAGFRYEGPYPAAPSAEYSTRFRGAAIRGSFRRFGQLSPLHPSGPSIQTVPPA
jgi:hypothetical protein